MQTEAFDLVHEKDQASWLVPALQNSLPEDGPGGGRTLTMFDLRKLRFRALHLSPEWEQGELRFGELPILRSCPCTTARKLALLAQIEKCDARRSQG